VRATILQHYVRSIKDQDLSEGAIRGMLAALNDPYSDYLSADQLKKFERDVAGSFAGVGVQIQLKEDTPVVVTPIQGSPALQAGVKAGDRILAIDGHPTKGGDIDAAVKRILGPQGSEVTLRIRSDDEQDRDVKLTRAQVKVPSVKGFRRDADDRWEFTLDPQRKIGYVAISHFTNTTAADLRTRLGELQKAGVKGLVLDLRFCPGGLLPAAIEIAEQFVSDGTIVTVRGHAEPGRSYKAAAKAPFADIPLLVLVNEGTASAAEVVAGALKDNQRATILGTRTFGKGFIQQLFEVPGDGRVRLTTAFFFLPSGRNIHKAGGDPDWGVDPTDGFYVPLDSAQTEALVKVARQLDVIGLKGDGKRTMNVTPKVLADHFADPQLAAGMTTMTARIRDGAFPAVGKPNADLLSRLAKRDDLVKRRDGLLKEMNDINRQLADLEKRGEKDKDM
jgi:carboxyl-terminal processing protease